MKNDLKLKKIRKKNKTLIKESSNTELQVSESSDFVSLEDFLKKAVPDNKVRVMIFGDIL